MKSYKGAFRMLRLIRMAMGTETHKNAFEAIVEIDETYVGGKPRKENKHKGKKTKKSKRGRGTSKTPVVRVLERSSGRIHAVIAMPNKEGKKLSGKHLQEYVDEFCYRLNIEILQVRGNTCWWRAFKELQRKIYKTNKNK